MKAKSDYNEAIGLLRDLEAEDYAESNACGANKNPNCTRIKRSLQIVER